MPCDAARVFVLRVTRLDQVALQIVVEAGEHGDLQCDIGLADDSSPSLEYGSATPSIPAP
jgi:hypothetical protein